LIRPSQETCEENNGIFDEEKNVCKSTWMDAKKICRANSGRLATLDEYVNSKKLVNKEPKWTNTIVSNFFHTLTNATIGLLLDDVRNKERYADIAYTNEISQIGIPLTAATDKKLIVECVHGTSNYYLRNFDTK
jgi:hypothetical protein